MSWLDNPQFKVAVWWAGGGILSLTGVVVNFNEGWPLETGGNGTNKVNSEK